MSPKNTARKQDDAKTIRVLIADDHTVVRDGLMAMLGTEEDFAVVGAAKNGLEAVQKARELRPNVILMDLRMPEMDGVEAMRHIQAENPEVKVLVLTTYDSDDNILQAVQAGARGYLLKDASWEELFEAVRAAHHGSSYIHPRVAARLLDHFNQLSNQVASNMGLSARELEVLRLLAKGASNKEIAVTLTISDSTVKNHVASIFNKLGVRDRTEAVTIALQKNIIDLPKAS